MDDLFRSAHQTLGWGNEAFREHKSICADFVSEDVNPMFRVVDFDPETGEDVVKLRPTFPLPDKAIRTASEAVQHIKHAIDQGLTAACNEIDPALRGKEVRFPWADTVNGFRVRLGGGSSKIPISFHDAIIKLKPYGTDGVGPIEQDQIRTLARLANRKHTVNLTVAPIVNTMVIEMFSGINARGTLELPAWDAVGNNFELFRVPHGSQFYDDRRVSRQIVFDEGWPVNQQATHTLIGLFGEYAQIVLMELANAVVNHR